jgi:hypothetical protein
MAWLGGAPIRLFSTVPTPKRSARAAKLQSSVISPLLALVSFCRANSCSASVTPARRTPIITASNAWMRSRFPEIDSADAFVGLFQILPQAQHDWSELRRQQLEVGRRECRENPVAGGESRNSGHARSP